jgi:hypothetical protein
MATRTPVAVTLAAHSTAELCDLIEFCDLSYAKIAEKWGCTARQIQLWIDGDSERFRLAELARKAAADHCDREALRVLEEIPDNGTVAQVARAREIASHLRWRASKRDPAKYAEKIKVENVNTFDPALMTDAQLAAIAFSGKTIEGTAETVSGVVAKPVFRDCDTLR